MKVMQVMAGAEFGGAEAFFTRLVLALHGAGLDQRVVIRANERRANLLRSGGVEPVQLPFGGKLDIYTPFALKKEIKSFAPDIVFTWMNRATDKCPQGRHKGNFVHVGRLGGYYNLKYYQACDHLIGNTEDIVEYLAKEGWPKDRAHYLPNFVSEEKAPPAPRESFFTPQRAPLLFAMGRFHENKAFDILFKALFMIPDAYLLLAGDGPLRDDLEKLAENLAVKSRVRFLGWRDDTAALFAACDVFICPSRFEPLGNVVVEAWAQGVPVVAADSLGPGVLIEHMESGVLTPVDDPKSMAAAIKYVLEEPGFADQIAKAGRKAYEERFTEKAVIARYLDFFRKVAS